MNFFRQSDLPEGDPAEVPLREVPVLVRVHPEGDPAEGPLRVKWWVVTCGGPRGGSPQGGPVLVRVPP